MDLNLLKALPFYIKLFILIVLVFIVMMAKEILSPLIFSCLFSILLLPFAAFLETRPDRRRKFGSV
jgi:predicted PurR-regulated permease PerM